MPKSISVVIPNYNGRQLLEANLPSVVEALQGLESEIIIVDDCSRDESIAFLQEVYPSIRLMVNEQNRGFSPTMNRGIFAATKELVLILNNDVRLTPGYFQEQFRYFEQPDTFGVMGKIIGYDNDRIQDAAKYPRCSPTRINATLNYSFPEPVPFWIPTFMLSGANALVDRQKLLLLQGFDEIYAPFYWEDTDLSLRAWRLGWKCYFEPLAVCRHPNSATIGTQFKKRSTKIVADRNKLLVHAIHLEKRHLPLFWLKTIGKLLVSLITFRLDDWRAFRACMQRLDAAKASREHLAHLASQRQIDLRTMLDVKSLILKQLEGTKYKEF